MPDSQVRGKFLKLEWCWLNIAMFGMSALGLSSVPD